MTNQGWVHKKLLSMPGLTLSELVQEFLEDHLGALSWGNVQTILHEDLRMMEVTGLICGVMDSGSMCYYAGVVVQRKTRFERDPL